MIIIQLKGGLIQDIFYKDGDDKVIVMDFDTEGATPEELTKDDNGTFECCVSSWKPKELPENCDLERLYKAYECPTKRYNIMENVGKVKYLINFHEGVKIHTDGSPFYDIRSFKNKVDLSKFEQKLLKEGYKYRTGV